jgi:dolichol-phosphate mannosyltransferase
MVVGGVSQGGPYLPTGPFPALLCYSYGRTSFVYLPRDQKILRYERRTVKVSVVLPTYNERENIGPLIEGISRVLAGEDYDYEVVVVDDDSPDGTAEAVRARYPDTERLKLICRNGQRSLATALKTGIEKSSGEVVVLMDADFSHSPQYLPALLYAVGRYDLVNGSRYLKFGGFQGNARARVCSAVINWFLRMVLRLKTTDNTSGFLAIKRSLLDRWDLDRIFYGYGDFHFRLLHRAFLNSASIWEVPIVHMLRRKGQAKTRLVRDGWRYVASALRIRLGIERI